MLFKNPYRILFLEPVYQKIISASNLLGILVGTFIFNKLCFLVAYLFHIPANAPLHIVENGTLWLFSAALLFPLSFYAGIVICAVFSGTYLLIKQDLYLRQLMPYMFQTKYPQQWFKHKPTF